MTTAQQPYLTPAEFGRESELLALEILLVVLEPKKQLSITLAMDALMRLYFRHAKLLPADAQKDCVLNLVLVARELLQAGHTDQPTAPLGAPVH